METDNSLSARMREIDCEIRDCKDPDRLFWLQFTMEMLLHDYMKGSNG